MEREATAPRKLSVSCEVGQEVRLLHKIAEGDRVIKHS